MAKIVADDLTLCECCAIAAANSDVSGCENYSGHTPHALSAPMEDGSLVVGEPFTYRGHFECYGCDEIVCGSGFTACILR